ncbi:MAG: transaldolase family protein [Nitrospirales bacterium]
MKFYLDTASMTEIQEVMSLGLLDGVAMNAYSSAEQGMTFYQGLREICRHVNGPISVGMLSIEEKAMIKEGKELAKIHGNIIVKCPLTPAGLKATKRLTAEGIRVNVSLCFSLAQALVSAKAGAWCVSLCPDNLDRPQYIETNRPHHEVNGCGNEDSSPGDGIELIRQIVKLFQSCGYPTQIMLTGIRSPEHVKNAALGGAHICMMAFPIVAHLCDPSLNSFPRPISVGQENYFKKV